jgi:quinol monooxygenase YgiN
VGRCYPDPARIEAEEIGLATLLVHLEARKGQEAAFEATARELYEKTHALEPGCRRYEYWRGAEPGHYYALLSFDDFRAFIEHQSSDHHEAPDYGAMLEEVRLEWVDPVQGACELVPTNNQAMPDSASDLMKTYAQQYVADVQDWWAKQR